MLLRHVTVQNFRGIERARLVLGRTTVLLGENDSGKSRLMDALAIAMGLDAEPDEFNFQAHDFTRQTAGGWPGTISISLRFEEAMPDEWQGGSYDPLRPIMTAAVRDRRQINLHVSASSAAENIETSWSFRNQRGQVIPHSGDPEYLIWLRLLNPLVLLRQGFLSLGKHEFAADSHSSADRGLRAAPGEMPDQEALRYAVEAHYSELASGSAAVSEREIDAGFIAARELVHHAAGIFATRDSRSLLQAPEMPGSPSATSRHRRHGSGAQRLGLLLAVGALLEAHVADFWPEAEPIVIIEDPETHLHPLTLASVWNIINGISWQKVITTHSGDLLAAVPLSSVSRLHRKNGNVYVHRLRRSSLRRDELRKVSYHVRAKRGTILFSRCWLLVEGETEFWMLPRLAELCGYELAVEGVAVVEFAQCGVTALIRLAKALGIQWHVLADGDTAGQEYAAAAGHYVDEGPASQHVTKLDHIDIERCLWHHGYADLYRYFAGREGQGGRPGEIIHEAIRRHSKPFLALAMAEAAAERGPEGVPMTLRQAIEAAVALAREN